jgi:hypothetical protein
MKSFAVILALAASAFAYQITSPTNATGWTVNGPNVVTWTTVSTDPANFTIVLNNQASYPPTNQILDALVVGTLGTINADPPSGGWVAGPGFRVNFVASSEQLTTILAQSGEFTILPGSGTASVSSTSHSSAPVTAFTPIATTSSTPTVVAPTTSDTSLNPTSKSGAASHMVMQSSLFGLVALAGAFLA